MSRTLDDYDNLGILDNKGFSFEMENLAVLKDYQKQIGFEIAYHNSENPHKWKRTKGFGTDLEIKVKNGNGYETRLYIEESYCSRDYCYRKNWFYDSRLKRFAEKPHGRFDTWIVLTNRTVNFKNLEKIAKKLHVKIFNLNQLLHYINRIRKCVFAPFQYKLNKQDSSIKSNTSTTIDHSNTTTNNLNNLNNVYAYGSVESVLNSEYMTYVIEYFETGEEKAVRERKAMLKGTLWE